MKHTSALAFERALEKIHDDDALNAWSHLAVDEARAAAIESDSRVVASAPHSAIEGHLVALKGNIAVRGWPYEGGLLNRRGIVAQHDATLVRHLRAAGAVLIGQTRMDAGALGAEGRSIDGPIRNPRLPTHSVGGSSGGCAAALAAGHVDLAIGTDTIGSVRIPASFCGIASLKPSPDRITLDGVLPVHPDFDHAGPMTSRSELLRPLFGVLAGLSLPTPSSANSSIDQLLGSRPVGFMVDVEALGSTPRVAQHYQRGLDRLRSLGTTLIPVELAPLDPAKTRRAVFSLCEHAMAVQHRDELARRPENYSPELRAMLEYGASLTRAKLDDFQSRIRTFADAVQNLMQPLGALILPTTPGQAFDYAGPTPTDLADLTVVATAAGLPAASVPLSTGEDLPVGLQIVAARGEDLLCCDLASRLESVA
jgi:Asp-tRNA(Asn)/Glu-tRNA(Gln) amidotransferase A subunit family amidase